MISTHTITATVDGTPLDVTSATLGLDETWSPYGQGSLTVAMPAVGLLQNLDPRLGKRVQITLQESFGSGIAPTPTLAFFTKAFGGYPLSVVTGSVWNRTLAALTSRLDPAWFNGVAQEPVIRSFDLGLRARSINHRAATLTLELATDEALLQDHALVAPVRHIFPTGDIATIVRTLLARVGGTLEGDPATGTTSEESRLWEIGQSAWDYLTPIIQQAGLRLWCDEERLWHLDQATPSTTGHVSLSASTNITAPEDSISLDGDWCDAVVIFYTWKMADGSPISGVDIAGDPFGVKVLTLYYDAPNPGPGAAAKVLARRQGRGRVLDIRAISNYAAQPSMATTLTLPDTPTLTGAISAVQWEFPADEMRVTTRDITEPA